MPELTDILYRTDGPVAVITMNRPQYHNAQSYPMLDSLDAALQMAMDDPAVLVAVVTGAGPHFSSGHDLGTPEQVATREARGIPNEGLDYYDSFRKYNYDYCIRWRNMPKPTIAMVRGFCIFGGWMIASSMDLVFADDSARFLASQFEYFSLPWDVGPKKAKELIFESRFVDAEEAMRYSFVNRIYPAAELEAETIGYAKRVAESGAYTLRMAKVAVNHAWDAMGYTNGVEVGFADYLVRARTSNTGIPRAAGGRRQLGGVDLALRGERGERPGQPNAK